VPPRSLAVASLLALAAALPGCGYSRVSYPKSRAESLSVAVQLFENRSFDPGYENLLADALKEEFARRGALRLTRNPETADVVLRGAILPIGTGRRSFSSVVLALEYSVSVGLEVELQRPGSEIGIDRRLLREDDIYLASSDVEVTRRNRQEALRRIAGLLAVRIHDVVFEVAPP